MTSVDWNAVILGLLVGAVLSTAYFAGLGWGMRAALRANQPVKFLMLSAVVRIAALLGVGWAVVWQAGPWAFAGYAVAFFVVRTVSVALARTGSTVEDQP